MEIKAAHDIANLNAHSDLEWSLSICNDKKRLQDKHTRIEFQERALNAAKNGISHIVLAKLPFEKREFLEIGLEVEELVRNDELEKKLKNIFENSEARATMVADRFIFDNPKIKFIESTAAQHRNLLISLIFILWDQGILTESTSTQDFENYLISEQNVEEEVVSLNRFILKAILDDFKTMKIAEAQCGPIAKINALLPSGLNEGFYVTWVNSGKSGIDPKFFSGELLCWYNDYWQQFVAWFNFEIDEVAREGLSFFDFSIVQRLNEMNLYGSSNDCFNLRKLSIRQLLSEIAQAGYFIRTIITRSNEDGEILCKENCDINFDFSLNEYDSLDVSVSWK